MSISRGLGGTAGTYRSVEGATIRRTAAGLKHTRRKLDARPSRLGWRSSIVCFATSSFIWSARARASFARQRCRPRDSSATPPDEAGASYCELPVLSTRPKVRCGSTRSIDSGLRSSLPASTRSVPSTTTPAGKAMFQMLGVFAEFERAQLEAALKDAKPVQFKQNIALVLKYFDKLAPIMQEQDLKLRPAD